MFAQAALQQAECDNISEPPLPGVPPPTFVGSPDWGFSTTTITNACYNTSYTFQLAASGGVPVSGTQAYNWQITSGALPTGLVMNTNTGFIGGVPAASGDFSFTVRITDGAGVSKTRAFSLSVCGTLQSGTLDGYTVGSPYSDSVTPISSTGCGSTFTYTLIGVLPQGLSLDSNSGIISGTPLPAASGAYNFSVRIASAQSSCTKSFSIAEITVSQPDLWFKMEELAQANRVDAVNGVELIVDIVGPNATLTNDPGIIGFGTKLTTSGLASDPASLASLDGPGSVPLLDYTGGGFSFTGWMMFEAYDNSFTQILVYLLTDPIGTFNFQFTKAGSIFGDPSFLTLELDNLTDPVPTLTVAFEPQLGLWYFYRIWYDANTGKVGLQIDLGTKTESVITYTLPAAACSNLHVGVSSLDGGATDWGTVFTTDEVNHFPVVISDAAATFLYNAGGAQTWPVVVP
jgi:hypothetical protein